MNDIVLFYMALIWSHDVHVNWYAWLLACLPKCFVLMCIERLICNLKWKIFQNGIDHQRWCTILKMHFNLIIFPCFEMDKEKNAWIGRAYVQHMYTFGCQSQSRTELRVQSRAENESINKKINTFHRIIINWKRVLLIKCANAQILTSCTVASRVLRVLRAFTLENRYKI